MKNGNETRASHLAALGGSLLSIIASSARALRYFFYADRSEFLLFSFLLLLILLSLLPLFPLHGLKVAHCEPAAAPRNDHEDKEETDGRARSDDSRGHHEAACDNVRRFVPRHGDGPVPGGDY
jgi:hypothetical protein